MDPPKVKDQLFKDLSLKLSSKDIDLLAYLEGHHVTLTNSYDVQVVKGLDFYQGFILFSIKTHFILAWTLEQDFNLIFIILGTSRKTIETIMNFNSYTYCTNLKEKFRFFEPDANISNSSPYNSSLPNIEGIDFESFFPFKVYCSDSLLNLMQSDVKEASAFYKNTRLADMLRPLTFIF